MTTSELMALRRIAGTIAMSVRNHVEDMHAEGKTLTDDNMKEFNTNVRKGIYQAMLYMAQADNPMIFKALKFLEPPDYREEDCYDEVENNLNFYVKPKGQKQK